MKRIVNALALFTVFLLAAGICWSAMGDIWSVGPPGSEYRITADRNFICQPGSSTGYVQVLLGNLKVGDGAPGQALDGEDVFIEGIIEVDDMAYLDSGLLTATINATGAVTFDDSLAVSGNSTFSGLFTANNSAVFNNTVMMNDELELNYGGIIGSGCPFFFGDDDNAIITWDTTETRDSLKIGVGDSNYLILCQTADALSDIVGDVTAADPTLVIANGDTSCLAYLKHDQFLFSNGENINNSIDHVIDTSSADYGLKIHVSNTNPDGVIDAPAGCVMVYSSEGNQYFMVSAGSSSWWGITMTDGSSLP
ncbi:MAG: hypothetical protein J7M18_08815 [Candidatus Eremiobacteraeota bacterium]|nr:hypothetical protein [Candidatus Eremiobacteraeota bacterium]